MIYNIIINESHQLFIMFFNEFINQTLLIIKNLLLLFRFLSFINNLLNIKIFRNKPKKVKVVFTVIIFIVKDSDFGQIYKHKH